MLEDYLSFHDLLINGSIEIFNKKLNQTIKNYRFLHISEFFKSDNNNQEIFQNFNESKIIIINQSLDVNQNPDNLFFIICFKQTFIIIEQKNLSFLDDIFHSNQELAICFLSCAKENFDKYNKIQYKEFENSIDFSEDMDAINNNLEINHNCNISTKKILPIMQAYLKCFSCYLIIQAYSKFRKNRLEILFKIAHINLNDENENEDEHQNEETCKKNEFEYKSKIKESDYIDIRTIGIGCSFKVDLIYHIEKEEFMAIKIPNSGDPEINNLMKREINNYSSVFHPLLPRFFGTTEKTNYPVFEYINGQLLSNIKNLNLDFDDKLTIIFEIIIILKYLHENEFIYRDLKPSNIIIDCNKTAVLIDFDRMVKISDINAAKYTADFASVYNAPEVNYGNISYKNDIYSLGQLIYFIMNERNPSNEVDEKFINKNVIIQQIYHKCTNKNYEERPLIQDIFFEFCLSYQKQLKIPHNMIKNNNNNRDMDSYIEILESLAKSNDAEKQFTLGLIYYQGTIIPQDINKAIYYLTLAAEQNHSYSQLTLGNIYCNGENIERDINKALHYFTLAANNNSPEAQYNLGLLYFNGELIPRNINKGIYYYTLAANNNNAYAQYNLSVIYNKGKYVTRDIQKSFYLLTLAAEQKHPKALYNLGLYYERGIYVARDINKAIHYYTIAADLNNPEAQVNLAMIYNKGESIPRDTNKMFNYLNLAANNNHPLAQYNLGYIYYMGEIVPRDIKKAIFYLTPAADNNNVEAQYYLAFIHLSRYYGYYDIKKAIYYFQLAADHNNVSAQYNLGMIYSDEKDIPSNISKAIYYFSLAANQGHKSAQLNLGTIYFNGDKIKRDIQKAIYYFTLSANQNEPRAQFNLGFIFYRGIGIKRDIERAKYYYTLAANQDDTDAQVDLGYLYFQGEKKYHDIQKAIEYFSLAAKKNNHIALYNLALVYEIGEMHVRDIKKAIHYYIQAAKLQNASAQYNLGIFYYNGQYVKKDLNKSIFYLTLAANQSDPRAQYKLGQIYLEAESNQFNINKGVYYMELSSNNRFEKAHFILGFLYFDGTKVKRDIQKAIHYYKEASSLNNVFAKNNLAILYKNGFGNDVKPNIALTVDYLNEAIKLNNNPIAVYNLSHFYLYSQNQKNVMKSIEVLISHWDKHFFNSNLLLCIALIKEFGNNIAKIEDELNQITKNTELISTTFQIIYEYNLINPIIYNDLYENYKKIELLFNHLGMLCSFEELKMQNSNKNSKRDMKIKDISYEFYKGFEFDV